MDNNTCNVFKTPQKMVENKQKSPTLKYIHRRSRSPLANIQMTSVVNSGQYTTGSPIRFLSQTHCSPPAPPSYFKIRNPFERTLVESLNTPMCSPGMFKIRESSGSFKWDIEHVSVLKPADIVVCNSQFDPSPDPILEKKATEAIEKFFSQEMIVPSPFDQPVKRNILLPTNSQDEHATTPESSSKILFREASAQTVLTFPSDLSPEMENLLKPFYSYTKGNLKTSHFQFLAYVDDGQILFVEFEESNTNADPDVSANASLRRKLCFEATFSDGEEDLPQSVASNLEYETMQSLKMAELFAFQTSRPNEVVEHKRRHSPEEFDNQVYSPIIRKISTDRYCSGQNNDNHDVKSPSLSPIRQFSSSKNAKDTVMESPLSPIDYHHSCDASPFSQSTPEKCSLSKISAKSSPDIFNISESLSNSFNDFGPHPACDTLNDSKKRSQSEVALSRTRSAMKLDFNMDISSDTSLHFSVDPSVRCFSVLGASSDSSISSAPSTGNLLCTETAQIDSCSVCCKEKTKTYLQSERFDSIVSDIAAAKGVCDKCAIIHDKYDSLSDAYQFITPTKNYKNALENIFHNKHREQTSTCSPMQMSLDNSFNLETNKHPLDFGDGSIQIVNATAGNLLYSVKNSKDYFSSTLSNGDTSDKNDVNFSLQRTDSGFNDNFCHSKRLHSEHISNECDRTMCNKTKLHSNSDITKSFNFNNELSSVSWKRFDSGFNEETSDTLPQTSCHEHIKQPKKYTPITEYSEHDKENVYYGDFNKVSQPQRRICDSMSISDIFTEDMVSFNCNFSSTPSKNLLKKSSTQ